MYKHILCGIIILVPSSSFAQEACTGLLTYVGRDTADRSAVLSLAENIYTEHCEGSSSRSSSSGSLGLDAVVKAIPVRFNAGGSSSKERLDNFCKLYDGSKAEFRSEVTNTSTVVRDSISAFNSCVAMIGRRIYFQPTLGLTQVSVDVRRGSDDAAITGLTYDENLLECRLPPRFEETGSERGSSVADENSLLKLDGDYVTISCLRKPMDLGGSEQAYPYAELTIATSRGNMFVPIPADVTLPVARASEIQATMVHQANRISEMEEFRAGLVATQLYQCPRDNEHRPGDWATWGCLGQISSVNECVNYTHSGQYVRKTCSPITAYVQRQ